MQVEGGADWLERRAQPPGYGFAFAPGRLPPPWLYAPQLVAHAFAPRHQRWLPAPLEPDWSAPLPGSEGRVILEGRIPRGEVLLPVPLFGRLEPVELGEGSRWLVCQPGKALLLALDDQPLRYTVELGSPPVIDDAAAPPRGHASMGTLLRHTVPDEELPLEAHDLLRQLQVEGAGPLTRALQVRDFVRTRYRYDPTYLEDPEVASWLRRVTRGRANVHIALLHAGRDGRHLGRGVCYELNVLACELLRRAGLPSAVAVGWVLEGGQLSEPDHLWAVALLPSRDGPRWFPVDASTTSAGRPLRVPRRRGNFSVRGAPPRQAPTAPDWAATRAARPRRASELDLRALELRRVIEFLQTRAREQVLDERELGLACQRLLQDPERAKQLIELIRELGRTD